MIVYAPAVIAAIWAGLTAVGCTWVAPMLGLFIIATVFAAAKLTWR